MDHELEPGNLLVLMPMLLGINIAMKGPGWNVKKTLNTLDWSPAYSFVGAARVTMCFSVNCLRPLLIHDVTRAYAFATYASVYYSYAFFSFFGFLLIPVVESLDFGGGGRKLPSWHLERSRRTYLIYICHMHGEFETTPCLEEGIFTISLDKIRESECVTIEECIWILSGYLYNHRISLNVSISVHFFY